MISTSARKSFLGAALGTMVEYYDYALFSMFMPIFSPLFFPAETVYQSLVKGYFIILITMIARPLGGIFFGHIGDVLGRRKALLASMYGIALATTLMGLTPSYAHIGIWAMVLISFTKAVQIFCFGGEYNGAGIYVIEHAQNKNEGLVGSLLTATTLFGSFIASLIGVILTASFMPTWSWRLAFLFGGAIGVFGIYYRKNLLESPQFKQANEKQGFFQLIKLFPLELLAGLFIGGFATVPFSTVVIFINPVLMSKGYFNNHQLMILQAGLIFVAILTLIPAGWIADKKSPLSVMRAASLALIMLSYPLACLIDSGKLLWILLGSIGFIMINEILLGPSNAYLKNLFPMQYRYRGSSLGFCLGMSLFGGLTPVVENYLYQATGSFSAISLWLIFLGLGTFLSLHFVQRKRSRDLCEEVVKEFYFPGF